MADLIDHLESFLGAIAGGSQGDETTPEDVQVAWFPDAPFDGVTTVVTIGLSRYHLGLPDGGSTHQELLMHVPNDGYPSRAAGVLFQMASEMVTRESALLDGQLIGPRGPLFPESRTTALIAISPRYLPEEFAFCQVGESVHVYLTWLVPVTTREAEAIRDGGWEALVASNPDFANPSRPEAA